MTLIPLLVLPLVGGFVLFSTWRWTHYYGAREDGQRLYLRSAFYGAFLTVFSGLAHILLFVNFDSYQHFIETVASILNTPDAHGIGQRPSQMVILFSTIIWGIVLGQVFSLPSWLAFVRFPWRWARYELEMAYKRKSSDLELLILKSQDRSLPIMITLAIGKVYVGWPTENVPPSEDRKTLRILPITSGYRDDITHKVHFTTEYLQVQEESGLNDNLLEVTINAEQIVSSRLFDWNIYAKHFRQESQDESNSQKNPYTTPLNFS